MRTIRICAAALLALALGAGSAWAQGACYVQTPVKVTLAPPKAETIGGRPVLRFIPPHPKGVIYLFHGTGGSEKFALRLETVRTLAPLVAAGYGYVAAPSADRTNPIRWKVDDAGAASNPDIAYMLALHAALIARGEITAKTPVFTMGMSNGGAFANLFASVAKRQHLPVAAVADYMGPFPPALRALVSDPKTYPPTMVITSRNDGYVNTDRNLAVVASLVAGGAPMQTHLNLEHPVCADTFAVIPGLSAAQRETLVAKTLPAAGLIDAAGKRTAFLADKVIMPADMDDVRRRLASAPQGREVTDMLMVAWAAHEMRSDYASQQLALFDAATTNMAPR